MHATSYMLALASALFFISADPAVCAPGDVLWDNSYSSLPDADNDAANGMAVDRDGSVIVTGSASHKDGDFDVLTFKYGPDGALVWDRLAGETWRDIGRAVTVDPAGNVIVAGESNDPDNPSDNALSAYYTRYHVIRYSPLGEKVSEAYASGYRKDTRPSAVAVDDEGSVYVTGNAKNAADTYPCWYTVKFGTDGEVVYEKLECSGSDAGATGIGLERSGAVVVCGYYMDIAAGNYNVRVVKYPPDGKEAMLDATYNKLTDDEKAWAVAIDDKSDVVATGETSAQGGSTLTLKYTPKGDLLWAENRPWSSIKNRGSAVAVDEVGRVYVAGKTDKEDKDGGDFLLLIYDPEGQLLLDRTYPADADCDATGIVVCPDGSIVITGNLNTPDKPTVVRTVRIEGFRKREAPPSEAAPVESPAAPPAVPGPSLLDPTRRLLLRGRVRPGRFLHNSR